MRERLTVTNRQLLKAQEIEQIKKCQIDRLKLFAYKLRRPRDDG